LLVGSIGEADAARLCYAFEARGDINSIAKQVLAFDHHIPLAEPVRFLAYVMTYGTLQDVAVIRRYVQLDDFREALEHAPPGIMDERSWAYWNAMTGRYPVPPMPRRVIP
jgi:hypothetical protein